MKTFNPEFLKFTAYHESTRKADFNNLLKILDRGRPERPTLFEFFLYDGLYRRLAGEEKDKTYTELDWLKTTIKAYANAGYDYTTLGGSDFGFPVDRWNQGGKTISLNEGGVIFDRESFKKYPWQDPDSFDYSRLDTLASELPEGMKFIVYGPGGVLENVIGLTGYDNLCFLNADDPGLVKDIFDAVGSRLVRYYELCAPFKSVGALISNDDWGFNTQTMMSVSDLRKYCFPWHKKIVQAIHSSGKPAILHSCGQLELVMDDIIDDMKYDAKHSYEDKILPVEQVYDRWGERIAIFGGLDIDFLCRSTPEEIFKRSCSIIDKTSKKGSYALGSGNSIPYYIPDDSYLAMISAVR